MKKITKTLLTISGVCGGAGVILLTAGVALGARGDQFWEALSIQSSQIQKKIADMGDNEEKREKELNAENWDITVCSGIEKLDMDLGAREVYLEEYNGKDIQVYVEKEDPYVQIEQKKDELEIRMKKNFLNGLTNGYQVKILIPQEYAFEEVDLSIGAGAVTIDNLRAKSLEMQTGAGSIITEGTIQAQESSWEVAAGSISLENLQCHETDIDCAAGSFEAVFAGKKEEYYIEGDIGAGSFEVAGEAWEAIGKNISEGDKDSKKTISADCAAGSVTIDFQNE